MKPKSRTESTPASAETSAEIRAEMASVEAEFRAASEMLSRLHGERDALLAAGSDAALDELESRIAAAGRAGERLDVRLAILKGRLPEVEARERRAVLEERVAAARAAATRGRERFARMAKLARELAMEAAALRDEERVVRESWRASQELGAEKVKTPTQDAHAGLTRVWQEPLDVAVIPSFAGDGKILFSKRASAIVEENRKSAA